MSLPFKPIGPGHGKIETKDGKEYHYLNRGDHYIIQEKIDERILREMRFDDGDAAYMEISRWLRELGHPKT